MRKKKVMALALVAAMAMGSLAGCGSTDAEDTTEDTAADEVAVEETADEADDAEEEVEAEVVQADASAVDNLIAATEGTVTLTVWASEEDQEFTQGLIDEFIALYPEVDFDIQLGACSEANCKDNVLADPEAAADVYTFADDQLNELVNAGAIQAVSATYTYDVASENLAGSVNAATINGTLYAYPMTADNGYFLYYDSSVFSEEDVQSLDQMIEVAEAAGKKIGMIVQEAWYTYAFFGTNFTCTLNDDGLTNTCDWNTTGGTDVAQAIIDLAATGVFVGIADDASVVTGVEEGTYAAVVSGTWNADAIAAAWGDGYAAAKLPTYTCAGEQVQMSSFSGYKLIGVNPYSDFVGWSMLLAEYLTNEESQIARYNARSLGPANAAAAASDDVQSNPAIAALAAQAEYATPQRVGGNYWSPVATLGSILISGNPDGTDLQELLDTAVEGVCADVE